ncbi:hypothetical protein MKW94_018325 [Papaver nudicaule]|uniref:H15 domain-containing protein n=1 Tax=Papaver nudicaule TaxID=74823 RepID=A0AA41VB75_PAPNU|nr:hypothetical protein [Papaver nudicaule]
MPETAPTTQMITEAISSLKAKSGSSQHAIAKFIAEKYYGGAVTQSFKRKLWIQLNELTQSGKLVKVKRSFKLPAAVKKSSAVEEEIVWDGKYVDKFERLSEEMIPDEELIRKRKRTTVDLAIVGSMEKLMQVKQELIIESIPDFWPTVFMNDYSLRRHMNDYDKKIITNYLKSVVVEGRPYVTSVCTITLKFGENPHFENSDLTKKIHFSRERITGSSGTKIKWKTEKAHTGMRKSFFTWFEEESPKKLHDEVVNWFGFSAWPIQLRITECRRNSYKMLVLVSFN